MAPSKKHIVAAAAAGIITATLAVAPANAEPSSAPASPTTEQSTDELAKQITDKQHELANVNEEYLVAQEDLAAKTEAQKTAQAEVEGAQAGLETAKAQVAAMGVEAYKSGSLPTTIYLLSGESPQEFIDRANSQQYVDAYHDQRLQALDAAQASSQQVKDQADQAKTAAEQAEATLADKKSTLEDEIPKLQETLDNLNAEQQAALEQYQQQQIAAEAAANEAANGPTGEAAPSSAPSPASAPASNPAPQAASGSIQAMIDWAMAQQGKPYQWGATGPNSFDCSGFTMMAFKQIGISIPRTSGAQAGTGTAVPMSALQPGDLLYGPGHVGLYIGNGTAVHAPTSGQSVTTITASYFKGARRIA
ncbi:hypothetical protein EK0264_11970 [Epidermidibacterium keratini]|uniref:NlpC/P60 domain-containing protein n=1 Tax=Epidermidibacterium keratini TaxID=1891644 RepID=A0A7L4YNS2_9ACTN|nr:C40 family peptidase [Epidermidibacterium keratini]QHC00931.1 hypothetical protein EK0264_11970 [Epidermidibacterium keratini]